LLNAILFIIKFVFVSIFILILGNTIRWDGKTLSDQVKMGMSHAEESLFYHDITKWATHVTDDARKGWSHQNPKTSHPKSELQKTEYLKEYKDELTPTERQKLRALIKELNTSTPD